VRTNGFLVNNCDIETASSASKEGGYRTDVKIVGIGELEERVWCDEWKHAVIQQGWREVSEALMVFGEVMLRIMFRRSAA